MRANSPCRALNHVNPIKVAALALLIHDDLYNAKTPAIKLLIRIFSCDSHSWINNAYGHYSDQQPDQLHFLPPLLVLKKYSPLRFAG